MANKTDTEQKTVGKEIGFKINHCAKYSIFLKVKELDYFWFKFPWLKKNYSSIFSVRRNKQIRKCFFLMMHSNADVISWRKPYFYPMLK